MPNSSNMPQSAAATSSVPYGAAAAARSGVRAEQRDSSDARCAAARPSVTHAGTMHGRRKTRESPQQDGSAHDSTHVHGTVPCTASEHPPCLPLAHPASQGPQQLRLQLCPTLACVCDRSSHVCCHRAACCCCPRMHAGTQRRPAEWHHSGLRAGCRGTAWSLQQACNTHSTCSSQVACNDYEECNSTRLLHR
jgi:hypothetical protein